MAMQRHGTRWRVTGDPEHGQRYFDTEKEALAHDTIVREEQRIKRATSGWSRSSRPHDTGRPTRTPVVGIRLAFIRERSGARIPALRVGLAHSDTPNRVRKTVRVGETDESLACAWDRATRLVATHRRLTRRWRGWREQCPTWADFERLRAFMRNGERDD